MVSRLDRLKSRAFLAGATDRAIKSSTGATGAGLALNYLVVHFNPWALVAAPFVFAALSLLGSALSAYIGDPGTTSAIPGGH